jgi:hypothetical protein
MGFLQNFRFGIALGVGFAFGERIVAILLPWLKQVVGWALSAL